MRYLCEFLYLVGETSSDNILRFLANSNFLNQQKGRGSLSVRKMNLRSHETSVSIVTQAICTGIFKSIFEAVSAKHFKRSILSHIPECKIFNRKKVAELMVGAKSCNRTGFGRSYGNYRMGPDRIYGKLRFSDTGIQRCYR